jgi:phospholipase/lecithinase/hemolysin
MNQDQTQREKDSMKMAFKAIHWFLLAHLLVQIAEINARVPAIIVFGDSSVDSGNNNQISTLLKSNFGPYGRDFIGGQATGRFSNGRIPTDFVSEAFGIKPTIPAYLDPTCDIKDFATGVCFASAGTGYDNATSDVLVSLIPTLVKA